MAEFTTTPPASIPLSVSAFLRMFGTGGKDTTSLFVGVSEASHTFVTPFPGVLVTTQPVPHLTLRADIGGTTEVGFPSWKTYGVIPAGTTIVIKADSFFVDSPIGALADFVAAPESMALTVGSPTSAAPIPIALTPTPATAGYFGASAIVITDGNGVTANLAVEASPTNPDTYAFAAGGYKYLALPASLAALSVFKDNATNFPVPLAASADGYNQSANGLSFRLVTISGAAYRLYRTANILGGSITIYVS